MIRLPVIYNKEPLMPMKASRCRRFVKEKKAKICFDRKLNMHYLKLLVPPSALFTQDVILGLDPGSMFDGFSVVSSKCHHLNVELIQREKKGQTSIKAFKQRQSMNRRRRRCRLRHRPARFDNRTKKKLTPTIRANVDFRKWFIDQITKYYPINKMIVEDVRFNHYESKNGKWFSLVEIGKAELYRFIEEAKGLKLKLIEGFNTKKLRLEEFVEDPKLKKEKEAKDFFAHCVDSFVIAKSLLHVGDIKINTKVTFIKKIVKMRRLLIRTKKKINDARRYYRYKKGGEKVYFVNISRKKAKCRIKIDDSKSNHPRKWIYKNNGFTEKTKQFNSRYGGTSIDGNKKFYKNNEWNNRIIC